MLHDNGTLIAKTINCEKGLQPEVIEDIRHSVESCESSGEPWVIGLQEVTPELMHSICKGKKCHWYFTSKCVFCGKYRDRNFHILQGIGTITNCEIAQYKILPYDKSEGGAVQTGKNDEDQGASALLLTKIAIGDRHVNVFNTHGIWTPRGKYTQRQKDGIASMLTVLSEYDPGILIGDLNIPKFQPGGSTLSEAYKQIIGAGGVDCVPPHETTTLNARYHRNGENGTDDVIVDYGFLWDDQISLANFSKKEIHSDHFELEFQFDLI